MARRADTADDRARRMRAYWRDQMRKGAATYCPMCGQPTKSETGFHQECFKRR